MIYSLIFLAELQINLSKAVVFCDWKFSVFIPKQKFSINCLTILKCFLKYRIRCGASGTEAEKSGGKRKEIFENDLTRE